MTIKNKPEIFTKIDKCDCTFKKKRRKKKRNFKQNFIQFCFRFNLPFYCRVIFIDVFGDYTAGVKGIATMFTNTGLLLNP